jgi:hypothetical protein
MHASSSLHRAGYVWVQCVVAGMCLHALQDQLGMSYWLLNSYNLVYLQYIFVFHICESNVPSFRNKNGTEKYIYSTWIYILFMTDKIFNFFCIYLWCKN